MMTTSTTGLNGPRARSSAAGRVPILARRDVLKIVVGVPIAIGLPTLTAGRLRAGELGYGGCTGGRPCPSDAASAVSGDTPLTAVAIRAAVNGARESGRPVLLIATPQLVWDEESYARRQRIARRLAGMIEGTDTVNRLLMSLPVIIVATEETLRDARVLGDASVTAVAGASPVYLIANATPKDGGATRLRGSLDEGDSQASALQAALRDALFGKREERLARRRDAELDRLGGARAEVERALNDLTADTWERREAAQRVLRARRERILGVLAHAALTAPNQKLRARCTKLAHWDTRPRPLGTSWETFYSGCGRDDPYQDFRTRCGMAMVEEPARLYLRILSGS
jgi:hypothetical protein